MAQLRVVPRCLPDIKQELANEACSWAGDAETSRCTLHAALDLTLEAQSACCLIVAPFSHLQSLKQYARHADGGYFTRKFHDKLISHDEFLRAFKEFADVSIKFHNKHISHDELLETFKEFADVSIKFHDKHISHDEFLRTFKQFADTIKFHDKHISNDEFLRTFMKFAEVSIKLHDEFLRTLKEFADISIKFHDKHISHDEFLRTFKEFAESIKFHDEHISHDEFLRTFKEFADVSISDAWPADHPDIDARNQPKDGAMLFSSAGLLEGGAVEFEDLPEARFLWPEGGERHIAALQVASLVEQVVVIVKSDDGLLHVLLGRPDAMVDIRQEEPAIGVVRNMGGNYICGFVHEDRSKRLVEVREDVAKASGLPVEQVAVMRGFELLSDVEALVLEEATIDKPVDLTMIRKTLVEQEVDPAGKDVGEDKAEDQSALPEDVYDPAVGVVPCAEHGPESPQEDCRTCQRWVSHMDARAAQADLGECGVCNP